jgi:uncharacterized protein YhaN
MVIEAGSSTFTLDLHPRLTVVAGMGRLERDALAGELLGALASNRTGVHVEAVEDAGRRLAVFRPNGAPGCVVDVDQASDVTAEFVDDDGRLNLMRRAGLDPASARRKLRFGASDLEVASHGAQLVRQLAEADQAQLWAAAETLLATDAALQAEADALGSTPEDAEIIERVEQRHRRFEAAQASHERIRRLTLAVSAAATVGTAGAVVLAFSTVAIAIVLVALLSLLASVITRSRAEAARGEEAEALAAAGAQSYLGFHLQRVNGMMSSEAVRRRLMATAEDHRRAARAWRELAGEVPVGWALDRHDEITGAARVRVDITTHAQMEAHDVTVVDDTTDLARVLVSRLAELRRLGGGTESLPLILDDPLAGLDRTAKPALLELLSHASGSPQLIYLTDDEDVASWARLELLTGNLSIIEPAPEPSGVDRGSRPNLLGI